MSLDDLVLSYRDYYGTYHHHKEQMGFTAAALYLASATAVVGQAPALWEWKVPHLLLEILLAVSCLAGFAFVVWQLRLREKAADIVLACTTVATTLLSSESPLDSTPASYKGLTFPKVLVDELDSVGRRRGLLEGPRVSEFITYVVMLVWTICALVSTCCTAWAST